jgi:tRNA modification GTPase
MFDKIDDTIVAVSSSPGHSPRGIVRLSGPDALIVADGLFRPEGKKRMKQLPVATITRGVIDLNRGMSLPCLASVFHSPASYTGQDMIEFHMVGSPAVLEMLVEHLIRSGARLAEAGEFTARRFLSGAIDLSQAEAISAVIQADTVGRLRAARRAMSGTLALEVNRIQEQLVGLLALVEADIDFAEEPIDFIAPQRLRADVVTIVNQLRDWLTDESKRRRSDPRPHILLLGRANAGKSTLMNRLAGTERVIASPKAGTTRDIISAQISLPTRPALLLDAAGLTDDDEELSRLAVRRALAAVESVDLILYVVDLSECVSTPPSLPAKDSPPSIFVGNKSDIAEASRDQCPDDWIKISALTGDGIPELLNVIQQALQMSIAEPAVSLLNARQRIAVEAAVESLDRLIRIADETRETIDAADLLAFELRDAVNQLAQITGEVTTEDLLRRVFSEFCIGK